MKTVPKLCPKFVRNIEKTGADHGVDFIHLSNHCGQPLMAFSNLLVYTSS